MNKKKSGVILCVLLIMGLFFSCEPPEKERELSPQAAAIHEKVLTIDTHCDTPLLMIREDNPWDMGVFHESKNNRRGKVDLPRMKEGGLDGAFFAVYVSQGECTPDGYRKAREKAHKLINAIHGMAQKYPQMVEIAISPEEAYRLEKEGKVAAFIGMENGYPLGEDLSLVEKYYKKGVRYITLSHSSDNQVCDSSTDRENPEDNGLTDFGKKVVEECNRLGIIVDVSHVSEKSFYDVLKITKAPVIASHSCVKALCDHPRNLSDDQLEALAENGGTIQVCLVSSFVQEGEPNPKREKALAALREKYGAFREIKDEGLKEKVREEYMEIYEKYPAAQATLQDLVDHIDYVVKKIGIDHVGIGTDFDGGGGVIGCDNVSELPFLTQELLNRGYSEEEIRKIWGGNLMRVFKEVIAVAGKN